MKITRESIEKSSARMGNGWTLSRYHLVMCGEKAAELQIPMEDGGYIQGRIYIDKKWRGYQAYDGVRISVNASRYYPAQTSGVYVSHGLGHWVDIDRPDMSKCMFSAVEKITHKITADDIRALCEAGAAALTGKMAELSATA